MSKNSDIGPSFYFMQKQGKPFDIFLKDKFSTFHEIKTRTFIKNLRHSSLCIYVKINVLKFQVYKCNSY